MIQQDMSHYKIEVCDVSVINLRPYGYNEV